MKKLADVFVTASTSIRDVVKQIDTGAQQIALVVDENQYLLGTITDGDIRRYLLKQGDFSAAADQIMHKNPITALLSDNKEVLLMRMHAAGIAHLPILNEQHQVVGLETLDGLLAKNVRENTVIFMVGGMGRRLHPLTVDCPKPMLKVADKPIVEILLENFIKNGFENYIFSVNYKAHMIRDYFGSGERWGVNIQYIEELGELGTAGSLSLLPSVPEKAFFVINGDILTNVNFGHILDFHMQHPSKTSATLCVRQHQNIIPYGLVHIDEENESVIDIEEKPIRNYFVNAGIYVLEPSILKYLEHNIYCDMPDFLTSLMKKNLSVGSFPIREYWLDIGHHENLIQASSDYVNFFNS